MGCPHPRTGTGPRPDRRLGSAARRRAGRQPSRLLRAPGTPSRAAAGPPLTSCRESEPRDAEPTVPLDGRGRDQPVGAAVAAGLGPAGTPRLARRRAAAGRRARPTRRAGPGAGCGRPSPPSPWWSVWPAVRSEARSTRACAWAAPASTRRAPGPPRRSTRATSRSPPWRMSCSRAPCRCSPADRAQGATGSGFVLDDQGHVVTNQHVVAGVQRRRPPDRRLRGARLRGLGRRRQPGLRHRRARRRRRGRAPAPPAWGRPAACWSAIPWWPSALRSV